MKNFWETLSTHIFLVQISSATFSFYRWFDTRRMSVCNRFIDLRKASEAKETDGTQDAERRRVKDLILLQEEEFLIFFYQDSGTEILETCRLIRNSNINCNNASIRNSSWSRRQFRLLRHSRKQSWQKSILAGYDGSFQDTRAIQILDRCLSFRPEGKSLDDVGRRRVVRPSSAVC